MLDAQHMWARADHRLVTGRKTRLAKTTPATPATRLCSETPISRKMTATAAASTAVPITASTNRRTAGQVPVPLTRRRMGRNKAADPSGAATIPANSSA